MTQNRNRKRANPQEYMPDADRVAAELAKAESMDDFFGKDGIFAKVSGAPGRNLSRACLFSTTARMKHCWPIGCR